MTRTPLLLVTKPAIQHARIRSTAVVILVVRLLEGAAALEVLWVYYVPHTVAAPALYLSFAGYAAANLALYFRHRQQALTTRSVWLDILSNLLPMMIAAYWSGGVYSPLLPIFVVKIASYGLIYSADIGLLSLLTATALSLALGIGDLLGWWPTPGVEAVPALSRMRIALAFNVFTFAIMIGGSLRFFALLQQRDQRLEQLVAEKDRLYRESLRHQQELRELSRTMMQSSEATMRNLVRELHDDLGQALTAVRMDLGILHRDLPDDSPLHARVKEARQQIGDVLQSLRNLSQVLRPPVLDDLGLVPAMQWYAERFRERSGVTLDLDTSAAAQRYPQAVEVALYRVLQESLTNVSRHAEARHVSVRLASDAHTIRMEIEDDGRGFDPQSLRRSTASDRGIGVLGMRERVATYGGAFEIESTPGNGTVVRLAIPLAGGEG